MPRRSQQSATLAALALLSAGLVLAGCATTAADCDATEGTNVFRAASCDVGGGYSDRIAQLEAQAATIREETRLTEAEVTALREEADRLAADRMALRASVREQQQANEALRESIVDQEVANRLDRAEIEVLQGQLDQLSQVELELSTATDSAEIARLQQDIEERRAQIEALRGVFLAE